MKQLKANLSLNNGKPYLRLVEPNTLGACTTAHDAVGEWSLNFPALTFPPDRTFILASFNTAAEEATLVCWGIKQNGDAQIKITAWSLETGEPRDYIPPGTSILIQTPDWDYGAIE